MPGESHPSNRAVAKRRIDTSHGPLVFGNRCLVMGILNVTPDSFSDGGKFVDPAAAVQHGRRMAADGADIIDVGGESTRPAASPVSSDEQIRRVVPVIAGLRSSGVAVPISIDTQLAEVADAALDAGADMVNDVSGIRHDPAMPSLLAERGVPFVVMHMQGTPETMQQAPHYDDVVREIQSFFDERARTLESLAVDISNMIVDPGIGFGKRTEHNLTILRRIGELRGRWPVLVGASRKRFLKDAIGRNMVKTPEGDEAGISIEGAGLLVGTAAVTAHCALAGVEMVRVHDVAEMVAVASVCERILGAN